MIQTLRNLGAGRLLVIAAVTAGFMGFFIFMMSRLAAPSMALLYSGLDPADASKIVAKLDTMAVPYELSGGGSQIMVPGDKVAKLRMAVAQEGLPSGGSMGYEIFDRSESLGTSNFVLNIHHLRALEGELSRTIQSLNHVRRARVHLVLPRRELFSRTVPEPSASVVLTMQAGRRLAPGEVVAIQQLVASAVPNLQPSQISVIDGQGTLLAKGRGGDANSGAGIDAGAKDGIRRAYESEMARTIEEMLERSIGAGRVRAEVTADMDFDRVSTTTETYDPEGQVVRSTQTVEESSASKDGQNSQPVTVTSSLPATAPGRVQNPPLAPSEPKNSMNSNRTEETVNFEISKTVKTYVRESGSIKRLSVAVLVDGTYVDDQGGGKRTYKERSPTEIAQYKKLVETAIGYNSERGDKVEVLNLRFSQGAEVVEEEPRPLFGLGKNDYIKVAEILILGIVSILILLLVVRPLVKRVFDSLPDAIASSKTLINESIAAAGQTALPGGGNAQHALPPASSALSDIDLARIEGRVRDSTVKRLGEIVEKHPEEAVGIIRNWMYQET